MEFKPYRYQEVGLQFALNNSHCALLLDMGLGKTMISLLAIETLIYDYLEVQKVMVIAPKMVATASWPNEIEKWDNISHLTYSVVVGTQKQRLQALNKSADIYIINRENVSWLVDNYDWDFDMCVIDELSSFKDPSTKRFKKLRSVIGRCKRVMGLTGTPAPNGYEQLWSQMYLIDRGERLGKKKSQYLNTYFQPGRRNGYIVYDYTLLPGAEKKINKTLEDICLSMKKEDYLDLPNKLFHKIEVTLGTKEMELYTRLKKEAIINMAEEGVVLGTNAGAVRNKLQQIANGSVYTEGGEVLKIHTKKIEALEELIETANGKPVVVFYKYKHDKATIESKFTTRELKNQQDLKDWNDGNIPILIAHPASIGHGLNMQHGGHISIWFSLTDSLEEYLQANNRLHRPGQTQPVQIYHIVTKHTVDELILDSLENKDKVQDAFMAYFKAQIEEYKKGE